MGAFVVWIYHFWLLTRRVSRNTLLKLVRIIYLFHNTFFWLFKQMNIALFQEVYKKTLVYTGSNSQAKAFRRLLPLPLLLYAVRSFHAQCERFPFLAVPFQIFLFSPSFPCKVYTRDNIAQRLAVKSPNFLRPIWTISLSIV